MRIGKSNSVARGIIFMPYDPLHARLDVRSLAERLRIKSQGLQCKPVIQSVPVYFLCQNHLFHPQGSQYRNSPRVVSSSLCRPLYLTILKD